MNVPKSLAQWHAKGGHQLVRKLLEKIYKGATKVTSAKDSRTRAKAAQAIELRLAQLDVVSPDDDQTGWEAATRLREAITRLGIGFGIASVPLPRDPEVLIRIVDFALAALPSVRNGRSADKVNPYTLNIAVAAAQGGDIERRHYVTAVGGEADAKRSGENDDGAERAASRLKAGGFVEETHLGRVAGIMRKTRCKKG